MKMLALLCTGLAGLGAAAMSAAPAHAATRTFVSNTGSGSACTRTAPCADFQTAHDATNPGGEINCLNSGNYVGAATVTITKSITVDCGGTASTAIVSAFIGFDARTAGTLVRLRNLKIDGSGNGIIAIASTHGAVLVVENCVITNFNFGNGSGITLSSATGTAKLFVLNSVIVNSATAVVASSGVSTTTQAVLHRVRVERNSVGIDAEAIFGGVTAVQIRDSVIAGNNDRGISAFSTQEGGITSVTVDHSSSILGAGPGIQANGPQAFVILARSTVLSNNTGLSTVNGGNIFSYQDNQLSGNATDGAPTAVLTVK
jgi:hypothetical protein